MTAHPLPDAYASPPVAVPTPLGGTARQTAAPALRPWSRTWRYLAAAGLGLTVWVIVSVDYVPGGPEEPISDAAGGLLLIDLVLGILSMCLLPLRRRQPVLVAALTGALTAVSSASVGAAALATVSMAAWRRWRAVVFVGVVWVGATLVYETLVRTSVPGIDYQGVYAGFSFALSVAVYAIVVATGFYVGARRELFVSLKERAENAEREQAFRAEAAREAERTRIAREMHDVLAHRISLVAMHAGALAYRTDLTADETTRAAGIIADNAHLALTELRQVLGVLRGEQPPSPRAEPPQPTLADLPDLLDAARQAGTRVSVHSPEPQSGWEGLSETVSRSAYRIVQEALTNARKHAAGQPVHLWLARQSDWLEIEVHNALGPQPATTLPGAGVGLTGLSERAALVGGSLAYGTLPDGAFVLRAWLPWR